MRKWICIMLFAVILLGCMSTPDIEEPETIRSKESETVEKSGPEPAEEEVLPEEKVEKVVTETVYLFIREETISQDGFIDRILEISYEEEGTRRIEEKEFGIDGELEERRVYEYKGEYPFKVSAFDGSGNLLSYHIYEYSFAGLLLSDSLFTGKDELQVKSLYEYDSKGRKVKWIVRDRNEIVQAYTDYLYGTHTQPERAEIYTSSGTLESYLENEFDNEGHPVGEVYREADGSIWKYVEYVYSDDFLREESHYRGNDTLVRKVVYEYDSNGNLVTALFYGPGDQFQDKKIKYYTARSFDRIVVE